MRRYLITAIMFFLIPVFATAAPLEPLLNAVTLQFSAEQWVSTKTALVTIGVNASVNDQGLDKIQSNVTTQLNQIAKGEWHLVSFNRSLDQSGLERIQISAQARLSSADLGGLRDKAKAVSKPGETFTLDNVEFTPSDLELRVANTALRQDIYQQIQQEMTNLNKLYPDQKYYLHNLNFINDMTFQPQPQAMVYMKVAGAASNNINNNAVAVGAKLKISATVVFASAPNEDVVKMVHN